MKILAELKIRSLTFLTQLLHLLFQSNTLNSNFSFGVAHTQLHSMASRTQSELPLSAGVDGLLSGYQPTRRARVLCRTVLLLPNFIYRTHRCLLDRYQSGTGTGLFSTHIKEHNSGSVFFKATTYQTLTLNMKWQPNQQLDKLSQIEAKAKIHAACFLDKLHSGLNQDTTS